MVVSQEVNVWLNRYVFKLFLNDENIFKRVDRTNIWIQVRRARLWVQQPQKLSHLWQFWCGAHRSGCGKQNEQLCPEYNSTVGCSADILWNELCR